MDAFNVMGVKIREGFHPSDDLKTFFRIQDNWERLTGNGRGRNKHGEIGRIFARFTKKYKAVGLRQKGYLTPPGNVSVCDGSGMGNRPTETQNGGVSWAKDGCFIQ